MSQVLREMQRKYVKCLRDYLAEPGEQELLMAYELGRKALTAGSGVLGIASLHHEALREVMPASPVATGGPQTIARAEEFFVESLMPFEMSHRSHCEAIAALRHMNDRIEEEAKRIAHALHEEAGGLLASTHLALEELARDLSPQGAERLAGIRDLLDQVDRQLRRLAHELRPTILDDLGLLPALDFLSKGVSHRAGLPITVEGSSQGRLPPAVETTLYRNVQEALNNVVKHASAGRVTVRVIRQPHVIHCSVSDDGVGFNMSLTIAVDGERGLGLVGIRERLDSLRGTLQITSASGQGTELLMQIPLEA